MARRELLRLEGSTELLTLKHLAQQSGVDWGLLRSVVERRRSPYREIQIPKRSGGYRVLHAPSDPLRQVQRWILDNVLPAMGPRHPNSYAYSSEVSTIDCARRHVGATWLIKADIHDFFPSVTEREVYRLFRGLNYSSLLSFELARICTWPRKLRLKESERPPRQFSEELPYMPLRQGRLPQGAPTSGALANEAMRGADERLSLLALRNGLVYTRYSDDMVFSGRGRFSRASGAELLGEIRKVLASSGFSIHQRKSQLIPPGARKVVLGVLLTGQSVAVLPEQRRMLGVYLHGVKKYGLLEFVAHRGFESPVAFINHLYGWFSYLSQIDPEWVKVQRHVWGTVLMDHGVNVSALID